MISLLQLQYFLKLAREQHLTRAAEELFITQSTLSTMISRLEQEVGAPLFDRRNGRICLNACGKEYEKHIRHAMQEIEAGGQAVLSLSAQQQKRLSIAVSRDDLWSTVILDFKKIYPEYYIEQCPGIQSTFPQLLRSRTADFVITGSDTLPEEEFDSCVIVQTGICLAMGSSHPWSGREQLYLAQLEDEPYIELSKDFPFRSFCDALCAQAGITLNRVIEGDYSTRKSLVCSGQGVTLIADTPLTRSLYPGAAFVPIADPFARRSVSLFWLHGSVFTKPMGNFSSYVRHRFSKEAKK